MTYRPPIETQNIYPWELMYLDIPAPYLEPFQSNYHNLGLNGYMQPPRTSYKYKREGMSGDWGPRQQGCYNYNGVYPLDRFVMTSAGIDPDSKKCGFIKDTTRDWDT
jgi:hypothetical protein